MADERVWDGAADFSVPARTIGEVFTRTGICVGFLTGLGLMSMFDAEQAFNRLQDKVGEGAGLNDPVPPSWFPH